MFAFTKHCFSFVRRVTTARCSIKSKSTSFSSTCLLCVRTKLFADLTISLMTKHAPPYLHTRYLTSAQQAVCESNPVYSSRLADLRALRDEVEQIRGLLIAQEKGKLPELGSIARKKSKKQNNQKALDLKVVEEDKKALKELEAMMLKWDDELAGLAEALVFKPKVSVHCVMMGYVADELQTVVQDF